MSDAVRMRRVKHIQERTVEARPAEPLLDRLDECVRVLAFHGILGLTDAEKVRRRLRFLRETGE